MITSMNSVQMLTRYSAWAKKLIFEAVAKLPPDEITRERKNLFGNILRTLNHNYVIDLIWQAHLEGRRHGFTERNPKECPSLEKLWDLQQEIDSWYVSYSDKLSFEELDKKINFRFISGTEGKMTRNEILLHVVNHKTYHRGFVADMFYQIPAKPPTTDLPIFLQSR